MSLDALTVIPTIFAAAYGFTGLLVLFGRLGDRLMDRLERRAWRTIHRTVCPDCKRAWETIKVVDYDPDLGFTHDRPGRCPACAIGLGGHIDVDLDEISCADIRRIFDIEHSEPEVPTREGQPDRKALETVRAHRNSG